MGEIDVKIVKFEPMRMVSLYAYGPTPEHDAWQKLEAWAGPRGYLHHPDHRVFGFNNPNPTPRSPNYGYEFWVEVGPEVEPEGDERVIDFGGGLYAVARCDVRGEDPYDIIPATWKALVAWREESAYEMGSHQWLEQQVEMAEKPEDGFVLDLYLPIAE